jgi:hypothetical protein
MGFFDPPPDFCLTTFPHAPGGRNRRKSAHGGRGRKRKKKKGGEKGFYLEILDNFREEGGRKEEKRRKRRGKGGKRRRKRGVCIYRVLSCALLSPITQPSPPQPKLGGPAGGRFARGALRHSEHKTVRAGCTWVRAAASATRVCRRGAYQASP